MGTRSKNRRRRGHSTAKKRRKLYRRLFSVKRPPTYPYTLDARFPKDISWLLERIERHDAVCTECTVAIGQTGEQSWILARAEMMKAGMRNGVQQWKKDTAAVQLNTDESGQIIGATITGMGQIFVLDDLVPELGWWEFFDYGGMMLA